MKSKWDKQKLHWISVKASVENILTVILAMSEHSEGTTQEFVWLSSRGSRGEDHGNIEFYARNYGDFHERE